VTALSLLALLGGFALLALGAELLVRGAVSLAQLARIPPALVGLTVVAFGTSVPELAVCLDAAAVSRVQGAFLLLGLFAWCFFELVGAQAGRQIVRRTEQIRHVRPQQIGAKAIAIALSSTALGLLGVLGGASFAVTGATRIARAFGMSDTVIGLTILAIGTALPELATSVAAAFRGQGELAVGNVIGSNLFNLLGVLGAAALASPTGVPVVHSALVFDLPVMLFGTIICVPILRSERTVSRAEGGALLVGYAAYLALRLQGIGG